jgi:small subunit ribosomal protein S16
MLALRLQRTGRSGHSQFRLIVQDSRFSPKRGRVVAYVGNYDPHTKEFKFDSEKVSKYIENGAQPSDRVARLLKNEGVKLPAWVKLDEPRERATRNPDKRRSTSPAEAEAPAEPAAEAVEAPEAPEGPTEEVPPAETETSAEPGPAEETPAPEAPAEEEPTEQAEAPAAPAEEAAEEPTA